MDAKLYDAYRRLRKDRMHFRLQAAEAFPLLGDSLAGNSRRRQLYLAVDNQLPLIPAIAREFNIRSAVVRWLMGKDANEVGSDWAGRLVELTSYLSVLCPEHRPQTRQDWMAFGEFIQAIERPHYELNPQGDTTMPWFHKQWLRELGKMGWHRAKQRFESIGAAPDDISSIPGFIEEVSLTLESQLNESTVGSQTSMWLEPYVEKVFFSKGLIHQVQASLCWNQDHLPSGSPTFAPLVFWPAAFDGAMHCNGLSAVCLTSLHQLNVESRKMQHCVDQYFTRCLYSNSTIVSIRTSDSRPVSTAELVLSTDADTGLRFKLRQHKGNRNTAAPREAEVALQLVTTRLNAQEAAKHRTLLYDQGISRNACRRTEKAFEDDPLRLERMRKALRFHAGYDRFLQAAVQAATVMAPR